MTDPVTRLGEARKQIRIVAEEVHDDDELLGDLRDADALVETVVGELEDRPDEAAGGGSRWMRER